MTTDPIADMLTRIRNAAARGSEEVAVPHSKHLFAILSLLKDNGFVNDVSEMGEDGSPVKRIVVTPNYTQSGTHRIHGSRRVSRPSKRVYRKANELGKIKGGMGVLVLSTPKGVITDEQAREQKIGGEALFEIW